MSILLCSGLLALFATPAVGDPTRGAALFQEGVGSFNKADYATAVTKFTAALQEDPQPTYRDWLKQAKARMPILTKKQPRYATLTLQGPTGQRISLWGPEEYQASLPLPGELSLLPGRYTLESGSFRQELTLTAGRLGTVLVEALQGCPAPVPDGWACIPPGTFRMGSPTGEPGRDDDEPQHWVRLTRPFLMQTTEVTQRQWRTVMQTSPAFFEGCDECPVERVSWYDALAYANRLSKSEGKTECYVLSECRGIPGGGCQQGIRYCDGDHVCQVQFRGLDCDGYRLPTEAEWEYAARAGSTTPFHSGGFDKHQETGCEQVTALDQAGWYCGNAGSKTHPVRGKAPNGHGLYDVYGNVWEWCWDAYGTYPPAPTRAQALPDPLGVEAQGGSGRVVRGGAWDDRAGRARSAKRDGNPPAHRWSNAGFRLVRSNP